jgi:predicted ATPase
MVCVTVRSLGSLREPRLQSRVRPGILERGGELSALADAVQAAARGAGSVVLISGEAGIGRSSLVEAVRAQLPAEGRMLVGYCDDLATPRTLAPSVTW